MDELDWIIDGELVDAYDYDEQLSGFLALFDDVRYPLGATVVGAESSSSASTTAATSAAAWKRCAAATGGPTGSTCSM